MATINDIAKELGISKSTVSKALNNATDISAETKNKILETALRLGYTNKHIRDRKNKICILIENMEYTHPNHFGYDIIEGFKELATKDGWLVEVVPIDKEFQRGMTYGVFMMQNDFAASFILGMSLIDPWIASFSANKIPTVMYDNFISGNPFVASVSCDSREGIDEAIHYLKDLGHTKIGLLTGPLESYVQKTRYYAYLDALSKYNLEINEDYIGMDYYVEDSTKNHVKRMYDLGVTAILCTHDIRAISAIEECKNNGIRVPQDMSIVGFDDIPIAEKTDPPLTTIRQDRLAIGKAGYYAISCFKNNIPMNQIMLYTPLIIRESTGKPTNISKDTFN